MSPNLFHQMCLEYFWIFFLNANFVKFVSNVSCVHVFFAFVLFLAVCIQEGQAALKKN